MRLRRFTIELMGLMLLLMGGAVVQQAAPNPPDDAPHHAHGGRPRIGLALSGGGALGLAHVGVLKYLDEHHIPVDFVGGTSMGGLVGGFYATGLSIPEMEDIALHAPWTDLLRSSPKYRDRPIVEKQDWNRNGSGLSLRFGRGLSLPPGINSGQPLALMLSRYTAAYADLQNFDQLPVPFRCVATDLAGGDAFVLDHGSLPLALRATMAVPGLFTPVQWDDKVLVDGGVVDNIPVDVVRDMGADIVIAVSLENTHVKAEELKTLSSILRQVVSVMIVQNERRSLKQADIVITAQLGQIGSSEYQRASDIMEAGYRAAAQLGPQLQQYALSPDEWRAHIADQQARRRRLPQRGVITAVESSQTSVAANARQELSRKLPEAASLKDIEETLDGITAATGLPSAFYGWEQKALPPGYKVTFEDRPDRTTLLRPALSLQASGGEPSRATLLLNSTTISKDAYKSRLLGEIAIGYDPGIRAEYYAPSDGNAYFIAPGFIAQRTHNAAYNGTGRDEFARDRIAGTFFAGFGTWRFIQLRAGVIAGYDHYSRTVVTDGVSSDSTAFLDPQATLLIDTQNSGSLPSFGSRISASLGYSFRDHSYPHFEAHGTHFQPVNDGLGVFGLSTVATSFGRKLPFYDQFTAGGPGLLEAFKYQEFHTNTMVIVGGGSYYRIPAFRSTDWKPTLAAWYEGGRLDLGSQGWRTEHSFSLGTFVSTPLGPTGLALSTTTSGALRLRVMVGAF